MAKNENHQAVCEILGLYSMVDQSSKVNTQAKDSGSDHETAGDSHDNEQETTSQMTEVGSHCLL